MDGSQKLWSNRYYFNGGLPADWSALAAALIVYEATFLPTDLTFMSWHGYAPGSEVAIANGTSVAGGSIIGTGRAHLPKDCALVLRMATTKKSTKNHTVYVHSYFHDVLQTNSATNGDAAISAQRDPLQTFGDALAAGFTVGGRVYKRTTPDGALTTGATALATIGHRDFPR